MGSEEDKLKSELKEETFVIFKDFMTRVTKLEELGVVGDRLLNGFHQGLEFLRRPPINVKSELIKNILKANETKRVKSYFEAGCLNIHDSVENMSKLHTSLVGLHDHLNKAKSILNEFECLLEDVAAAVQTANKCSSPLWDKDLSNGLDQQDNGDKWNQSQVFTDLLMACIGPRSNHPIDDDQRVRAIATEVVTAAVDNLLHPQFERLEVQMAEVLLTIEGASANGNRMTKQGRGGANELTHSPTPVAQNPVTTEVLRNRNLPVEEEEGRGLRRIQGDNDYKIHIDISAFKDTHNIEDTSYEVEIVEGIEDEP